MPPLVSICSTPSWNANVPWLCDTTDSRGVVAASNKTISSAAAVAASQIAIPIPVHLMRRSFPVSLWYRIGGDAEAVDHRRGRRPGRTEQFETHANRASLGVLQGRTSSPRPAPGTCLPELTVLNPSSEVSIETETSAPFNSAATVSSWRLAGTPQS